MGWGNKQQVQVINKTTGIEKSKFIVRRRKRHGRERWALSISDRIETSEGW